MKSETPDRGLNLMVNVGCALDQ